MRETILILLINSSGILLMLKGVSPIVSIYFAVLIVCMMGYLYMNILALKKPNVDGNQQKASNN
ncbi:hypothetical protein BUZ94_11755 [Mammaliicoccus sciuri]|uniref:hypothetical protein n=1 Tax=Mammaliicoccus sciuri TaxID=1296 RepID=UPI000E68C900|nr:hypothetical protein [Mammaliicoccus sciuri]RIO08127.1 hypothetical protein BUZ94_11755 [Mammaliicoccus sciuri]